MMLRDYKIHLFTYWIRTTQHVDSEYGREARTSEGTSYFNVVAPSALHAMAAFKGHIAWIDSTIDWYNKETNAGKKLTYPIPAYKILDQQELDIHAIVELHRR